MIPVAYYQNLLEKFDLMLTELEEIEKLTDELKEHLQKVDGDARPLYGQNLVKLLTLENAIMTANTIDLKVQTSQLDMKKERDELKSIVKNYISDLTNY